MTKLATILTTTAATATQNAIRRAIIAKGTEIAVDAQRWGDAHGAVNAPTYCMDEVYGDGEDKEFWDLIEACYGEKGLRYALDKCDVSPWKVAKLVLEEVFGERDEY